MTDQVEERLQSLGIQLPNAPRPIAAYVPSVRSGDLLFVSGQLPLLNGEPVATGRVPDEVDIDLAQGAARQCLLNALAIVKAEVHGQWSRVERIVRLGLFVRSADFFAEQANVANGASELTLELFGDAGRHARAAVGVNALPLGVPVELEMTVQLSDAT